MHPWVSCATLSLRGRGRLVDSCAECESNSCCGRCGFQRKRESMSLVCKCKAPCSEAYIWFRQALVCGKQNPQQDRGGVPLSANLGACSLARGAAKVDIRGKPSRTSLPFRGLRTNASVALLSLPVLPMVPSLRYHPSLDAFICVVELRF